jgi:hypothetical protein
MAEWPLTSAKNPDKSESSPFVIAIAVELWETAESSIDWLRCA